MDAQLTTTLAMIAAFAAAMTAWAFFKARQFDAKYAASYRKAAVRASRVPPGANILPSSGLVVIKDAGSRAAARKTVRKKSRAG